MRPKDSDSMENNVGPNQTGEVWARSALTVGIYMSQILGFYGIPVAELKDRIQPTHY